MPKWDIRFDLRVDLGDAEIVRLAVAAVAQASVIQGVPISPYRADRLHRLNILRAVRGTTGIEGSDLTEEEVGKVLDQDQDEPVLARAREREEREVRNASRVLAFVADTLTRDPQQPLTLDLIATIHRLTTGGIPYANNDPGSFRAHNVTADTYSAPDAALVSELMEQFIRWLNGPPSTHWPQAVRAVAAHFYLVSIHPFGDGNGRTARAVESYLLYQARINACGFYSLANYYYRHRAEYIEMLDFVRFRSQGDLTPFIAFALRGLVEELDSVRRELFEDLTAIAFRDYARELLRRENKLASRGGDRLLQMLDQLTDSPTSLKAIRAGTHPLAAMYRGLSRQTLTRDVDVLVAARLVTKDGDTIRANLGIMEEFKLHGPL